MPVGALLRLLTVNGARAMGFEGCGVIAPGAPADLVIISARGPHWHPRHDLAAALIYGSHPADITHVIVDGRLLLRRGELLTLDEERIRHEAERRAFRMVGASGMTQVRTYSG